jgi:hypothetical protein
MGKPYALSIRVSNPLPFPSEGRKFPMDPGSFPLKEPAFNSCRHPLQPPPRSFTCHHQADQADEDGILCWHRSADFVSVVCSSTKDLVNRVYPYTPSNVLDTDWILTMGRQSILSNCWPPAQANETVEVLPPIAAFQAEQQHPIT